MKILNFTYTLLRSNSFVVCDENSKKCLIIDLGGDISKILNAIEPMGYEPCAVLLTHGHFDHTLGCFSARERGIPVYIHRLDEHKLLSREASLASRFNLDFKPVTDAISVDDGELNLFGFNIKIIHTPGHSQGSSCFIIGNTLFTGDTLFCETVGRADLPGGDSVALEKSLEKLALLDENYDVCPGHGETTTLSHEKSYNPYLKFYVKD